MRNIKIFTYLKIILFLLLVFVAVYYPTNEFDVITSNLLQIKILGQTAKIISTIFNDKILLLIMVLLSAFLFWIKEAKKAIFIFFSAGFGGLILFIIKYTVQRVRPLPDVFDGYSFPSGHSTIVVVSKYPTYILEDLSQKVKKWHSLKSEDIIYIGLEEYFESKTINKVSEIEFERDLLGIVLNGNVLMDSKDVIEIADKWYRRINDNK